jgi:LuxR family transcriptional regulator
MALAPGSEPLPQTGLAVLDSILPTLRMLGPQGFILVSNMGLRGPEFFHSEYPKEWQREYEAKNYTWGDPILIWSMMFTGDRRWSEINAPDPRGVLEAAKRFGITFGAIFSRGGVKKTVLSLSRADREFTDEEMTLISGLMDRLVMEAAVDRSLTIQEVNTLRHLRDGLSHKEIAVVLGIGHSTVKLRLSNARQKLGAVSNVHALAVALQRNLL